ncbi:LysR family transcriptional regulator [Microaerobacter geothermalis]|uniref:LysR family transcriptional regulator n=1 Tax=Microaerobacter geothermalis TaxID=674972 RepID=UPI001F3904B0|nr:LysR family transcriptional regulator [Microaerobacter geothermalis]MCF6093083.1 LysR family transcriptional regulator [Microaerobacter geothermalis]
MEFRQILYAIMVAEERNFSRAAEKLHIAQPSLSQQIAKLEQELGVQLFDRSVTPLDITDAGKRFLEGGKKIIDMMNQIKKEMEDVANLKKSKLLVGSLPITGGHILPPVLSKFQEIYPGIEVELMEETTLELEELTASGSTDVSLLTLPIQNPALEWEPLLEEEIFLAVPPHHPLSRKKNIHLRDVQDQPFILLKKGQGFRQIALNLCHQAGFQPSIVFESTNIETVQSLVAAGIGIAFVPKIVTRTKRTNYNPVYLSITQPKASRTIVMAYRRGRYLSKAAQAFIQTMKETVKDEFQ